MFDLNPAYFVFAPHAIAAVIVVALVTTLMRMFRYLAWEYVPAKFAIMKTYTTEAEDPTGSRKRILLVLGVLLVVGVFTALYELVQTIGFHPRTVLYVVAVTTIASWAAISMVERRNMWARLLIAVKAIGALALLIAYLIVSLYTI